MAPLRPDHLHACSPRALALRAASSRDRPRRRRRVRGSRPCGARAARPTLRVEQRRERLDVSDETVHGAEIARSHARGAAASTARRHRDAREAHPRSRPTPRATALLPVQSSMRRAAIERSGGAPHDLVGLVVDVLPDARWSVVGEIRARREPKRGEQNPRLAREERRLARLGHVRPAPRSGSPR